VARIKNRRCDYCGTLYSGRGDHFCAQECKAKATKGWRVLALFDAHTDPGRGIHPALQVAHHYCREVKPDMLVIGGDWFTFDTLSSFSLGKPGVVEGKRYREEIDHGMALLRQFADHVQGRKIFLAGNHEDRVRLWLERNPTLAGMVEWKPYVATLGFEVYPYPHLFRLGHLHYAHGEYYNIHHAKKHLDTYGANVVYGHTHTSQEYAKVRPIDQAPIKARSVGCLCGLNPEYRLNKSNAWVNEFLVVEYHPGLTGNYSAHTLTVVDGETIYGGQRFLAKEGRLKWLNK
jgi:hypothetical protein